MIGKLIKELRGIHMSQRELAQKIGVSHSYISKLENNQGSSPPNHLLEALATALACDVNALYVAAGKMPPTELNINSNTNYLYREYERFLHEKRLPQTEFNNELELSYHAFYNTKCPSFIYNNFEQNVVHINDSGSQLLKFFFKSDDDSSQGSNLIKAIAKYKTLKQTNDFVYNLILEQSRFLLDIRTNDFEFNHISYTVIQIFQNLQEETFLKYALEQPHYFSSILNNSEIPVIILALDDLLVLSKIKQLNKAGEKLLGLTQADIQNGVPFDLLYIKSDSFESNLKKLLQKKQFREITALKTHEGQIIPVELFMHICQFKTYQIVYIQIFDLRKYAHHNVQFMPAQD